jgi:hypothetical protein
MKYGRPLLFLFFCIIVLGFATQAQNDSLPISAPSVTKADSVKVSNHSPTTAILLSIIPGGGQIYNHKAWKIPIIYGLMGTSGYFIYYFGHRMVMARNEFINRRDGNIDQLNPFFKDDPDENLIPLKNTYMRNMELAIGATVILYTLNFIDAMVDAHLYYFDVSDDLSLLWSPTVMPTYASGGPAFGIGLQLRW